MILISACLCGVNCKYNGSNNFNKKAYDIFLKGNAMVICPEVLGGMDIPRKPNEIIKGNGLDVLEEKALVQSKDGIDSTKQFLSGALKTLEIANIIKPEYIILKANSPSCGCGYIYDGTFTGNKISGNGVTAEILIKNGFKVINEYEL